MRPIHTIVIHHSVSSKRTTAETIRRWHLERKYSDIGYHYVVRQTSAGIWVIDKGRNVMRTGAHVAGKNVGTIGICVAGNYEEQTVESASITLLQELITELLSKHKGIKKIVGHRDLAQTLCPGRTLYPYVARLAEHFNLQSK
jgi:N-acetylmuramoyl-L-alanine amidase